MSVLVAMIRCCWLKLSGRSVADTAVYAFMVVEWHQSSLHVVGVSQVGECVLPANDALDHAVIRFDGGILFWCCRTCKLMFDTLSFELFTYEM